MPAVFLDNKEKLEKKSTTYWYTENNSTLYTFKDVSLFYGNQKSSSNYVISEDGKY